MFQIEVLWSKGEKPLPPLHPLLIKGRNLYRLKTLRQVCTRLKFVLTIVRWSFNLILVLLILSFHFRDGKMKERDTRFWWKSTQGVFSQGLIEKHGFRRREIGKWSKQISGKSIKLYIIKNKLFCINILC